MGFEVGVHTLTEPQFNVSVDTADVDSVFADLIQTDRDVAVNARQLSRAYCLRDVNLAVNSVNLNRTIDLSGRDGAVYTVRHQGDLSWQPQGHMFSRL